MSTVEQVLVVLLTVLSIGELLMAFATAHLGSKFATKTEFQTRCNELEKHLTKLEDIVRATRGK